MSKDKEQKPGYVKQVSYQVLPLPDTEVNMNPETQQKVDDDVEDPPMLAPKPGKDYSPPVAPTTPRLSRRDPTLTSQATSSKFVGLDPTHAEKEQVPFCKKFKRFCHDSEQGTYCGRTCFSWLCIMIYAIMYLIFLSTYTLIFLYLSLVIIKHMNPNSFSEDTLMSLLTYSNENIGITGIPLSEHNYPLIWYRLGEESDYEKYVQSIDELLQKKREKRSLESNLGPCGSRPYGFGAKPCIVIKINKQLKWAGKPLQPGSPKTKQAPEEVQKWVNMDSKKYWLHCKGFHSYDVEHIGKIQYFPDPPGYDSTLFPLSMNSSTPLVAVQILDFTIGISLAIECKLWFESGSSSVAFMLYVSPEKPLNMRHWNFNK